MIRLSRQDDKEQIKNLLRECYGNKEVKHIPEDVTGCYLVYVDRDGDIAALASLDKNVTFDKLYLSNICGQFYYDGLGMEYNLISRLCQLSDERIYSKCLRLYDNKDINYKNLMDENGFELVEKSYDSRGSRMKSPCSYTKKDCIHRINDCKCTTDLYVRDVVGNIRLSKTSDRGKIKNLVEKSFGSVMSDEYLNDLDNRYLLYLKGDIIAGMSCLQYNEELDSFELGLTCTLPAYRNQGIQKELIGRLLNLTDEEIVCNSITLYDDIAPMSSLLKRFGFNLLNKEVKGKSCFAGDTMSMCTYYNGTMCNCRIDLYVRPEQQ